MLTVPQTLEENQLPIFEEALETLLTEDANAVAWQTGFTRRRSPITGAVFAQSLLFGWLARPDASYSQLQQVMEIIDCDVNVQALHRILPWMLCSSDWRPRQAARRFRRGRRSNPR